MPLCSRTLLLLGSLLCLLGRAGAAKQYGNLSAITWQNPGLPHDCITLTQRYDLARINKRLDMEEPVDPASTKAVVLTLHRMSGGLKADQALAFRALAAEVQDAGYHFWILLHMASDTPLTRWEALWLLPHQLHRYVVGMDFFDALAKYPELKAASRHARGGGPGPLFAYLPMLDFTTRFQAYTFIWEVEYDVRYIGDWGKLFETVYKLASSPELPKPKDDDNTDGIVFKADPKASLNTSSPPDLIMFGTLWFGDQWRDSQVNQYHDRVYSGAFMVYGGSRRQFDKMHKLAADGKGSYLETFIAQAAVDDGLKVVNVALPGVDMSWHCCTPSADEIYTEFVHQPKECKHNILLHAVRERDDTWPSDPETHLAHHAGHHT